MKQKIIAEIGINHQGNLATAEKMIERALDLGADYVKIQMRDPETSVPKAMWDEPKQTPWGTLETYLDYRKMMEFDDEEIKYLNRRAKGRLFPSVFDVISLERALSIGFRTIKIPSAMLTNNSLLSAAKDSADEVIISTGMSTADEIMDAVRVFDGNDNLIIMHCHSAYPAPDDELNLNAIKLLKRMFPYHSIGYSSHSASPYPPIYAMVLGAEAVEVHFTLDRTWLGSDHAASLEPAGLSLVCRERDRLNVVLGQEVLKLYDSELPSRTKLRGA